MYINDKLAHKGIFLLFGGLPPTIIESQVCMHIISMQKMGVEMEVWAFTHSSESFRSAEAIAHKLSKEYSIAIRVIKGFRTRFPFSPVANASLLAFEMFRNGISPSFIHARTEYAAVVAALVARFLQIRVIWDDRGDTLSEYLDSEYYVTFPSSIISPLKRFLIRKRLHDAARYCDAAIFVSTELLKLHGSSIPSTNRVVLPCLADEDLFYFSSTIRDATRAELGYCDSDIVLTYVGSTAPWQCISETVRLMESALRLSALVKAVIITNDIASIQSLFAGELINRVTFKTVELKNVNRYLNAADYGFLLRENNRINKVASPVKFAEYSLCGLKVVSTRAVEQINELGTLFGNTIATESFINDVKLYRFDGMSRERIASNAILSLSRGAFPNISWIYKS